MTKSNNIRLDHFTDCVGAIEEGMEVEKFEAILPYIQQMMDAYQFAIYEIERLESLQ